MEFLLLSVGCIVVVVLLVINKRMARWRFSRAVAVYERARNQKLDAGTRPSLLPTVEEFLAKRGELHLLREIAHPASTQAEVFIATEDDSGPGNNVKDDGYEKFVAEMWSKPAINLGGILAKRGHGTSDTLCELHSLVEGDAGRLYLNIFENSIRKTYAADSRHRWFVDGHEINHSVFIGINRGADPSAVLRSERYPASFEEAMSEKFDRFQTIDPRFAIAYQTVKGLSFRVVSRVVRSDATFSARCHFRWGERRTFRKAGLLDVFDMQLCHRIDVQVFLEKRNHPQQDR